MTIDRQADDLIRYVQERLVSHCETQRGKAEEQARQMVRQAFRLARLKVSRVVQTERECLKQKTTRADARLANAERQQRQKRLRSLLEKSREQLRQELVSRWQRPAVKKRWLQTMLEEACGMLPEGRWELHHDPGWSPEQEVELEVLLPPECHRPPLFVVDPKIEAGIRIRCLGVVLDGTLAGLLEDASAIDSRLLAHLEDVERGQGVEKSRVRQS